MEEKINALVLREVSYKESDKIITLLTQGKGIVSVKARGARKKNSALTAGTQILAYSRFHLYETKGFWFVREAAPIELFASLRTDLMKLSIGCYFAQVLEVLGEEDQPEEDLLRLGLNALYALTNLPYPDRQIKAVFELKALAISGFQPDLSACAYCGEYPREASFSISQGALYCRDHLQGEGPWIHLTQAVLAAMNFVLLGDEKRFFSFSLPEQDLSLFCQICENYFISRIEHRFPTLEFLKTLQEE